MDTKPKRENYRSDDAFGEAYGHWMGRQMGKPAAPSAPAPVTPKPLLTNTPARAEAERDTWNLNTKARFLRAKATEAAAKNKGE
jgi:hypothetical protein